MTVRLVGGPAGGPEPRGAMPYPIDGPAMTSQPQEPTPEALTADGIRRAMRDLAEYVPLMVEREAFQCTCDHFQRGQHLRDCPQAAPKRPRCYDPALLTYSQAVTDAVWERIHSWAAWDEARLGPFRWAWTEEDMGLTERPAGVDPAVEGPYGIPIWRSADGGTSRPAFHANDATTHHDRPSGMPVDPGDPEQWPASIREWPWSAESPYVLPPGCPCEQCVRLREEAP